ncbi:hemojuvelin [Synchiropus splendidus]|uniref:hemojuvelin n=1 Tax=Synchiropus splendidus TaxID=270530 RepID=UPI00237EB216|nr:hemojuvelin [Synchiropus splendidus]
MDAWISARRPTAFPWKPVFHLTLLLVQLSVPSVAASCRILRCNSEFVAATLDLGSSAGAAGGSAGGAPLSREVVNAGYCRALRSYGMCTRKMARACRGDLAYHSAVQGIEDLLIQHRCPRAGPTAQPRPLPQGTLSGDCLYLKDQMTKLEQVPELLHCGVFGDPHIRTFYNDFQTCAVPGAWPLVDNQYLYVQATSTPMRGGAFATALTKVTIIFKNWRHCVAQQLYQAELDNVPAAFADGSVSSGERHGPHSLLVRTQSPGLHAEIQATHIGTVLVVRQVGPSLSLSVRAPRSIVEAFGSEQDLQLCVWGCPPSQRLNTLRPPHVAAPPLPAHAHCGSLLPAQDVYYRACVFDVVTTGDLNVSAASVVALQDARALIADAETLHLLSVSSAQNGLVLVHPTVPLLLGLLGAVITQ